MKVAVVGLGIIGGSVAASLKQSGKYHVGGMNRSSFPIDFALTHGYIDEEVLSLKDYDVIIVALPPETTMKFLDTVEVNDGTIVADICGVKRVIEQTVYSKPRNYRYIGTHPMAGKETNGIESASPDLFKRANMILIKNDNTDEDAYNTIKRMSMDMGFGRIVECSSDYHDKKIAITSQLAHIVSNAYIKSKEAQNCSGFTGGSFQDMTRIAAVDENVWTDLYQYNRENLLEELSELIDHLSEYRQALSEEDKEKVRSLLKEGRLCKESLKK